MTNIDAGSRTPLRIIIALSIIYFATLFYMWHASNGLPGMKDQTESFTTYIAAKNFNDYGITNLSFLEDYATSPDPKAHPYYYTHNPDFPIYASYILIKMGFDDIRYHNLAAIFVLYAGLLFSYLFLKSRFSSTLALCVFGVSVFNYLGVLIFGLNIYRSFTWICVWGVLYFKHRWEESGAGLNMKLFWALLFMFMAVYFDYGVSGFIILITIFDKLFNWKRLTLGKLILYLSLSVIPSFGLHLVSVISAIGWDTFSKDIMLTIGNRMYGFPSRDAIADFYRTNHIVLWGYNLKIDSGYLRYAVTLFYERVRTTVGYGTPQLALLSLIAAVVMQARYFDRFQKIKEYRDEAKMLLTLFLAMLGVAMLLPAHFVQLYLHPFAPLVIFFVDFPRALLFAYAYRGIEHYKKDRISIAFKAAFAVGIAIVLFTQYRKLGYEKIRQMPASEALAKYKGHTFYSNYLSTYTSYFTGNWSGTRWAPVTLGEDFFGKEHLFEADKISGADKYSTPDFVLCINSRNVAPCVVSEQFYDTYPVTDEGEDYIIFDVRSRKAGISEQVKKATASTQWRTTTDIEGSGFFFPRISAISASSILPPNTPQNLLDDAPGSVWHRAVVRDAKTHESPKRWGTLIQDAAAVDWVEFDFGVGQKYAIDTLAAQPNKMSLDQFFHNISIKGSDDGKSWVDIADGAQPAVPAPGKWATWRFANTVKSRFYRVIIKDGFAGGQFYSLAELRLGLSRPR